MKSWSSLFIFFLVHLAWGQKPIGKQALAFKLDHEAGEIEFILLDSTLEENKPVFLFCQGSLPVPLFIDFKRKAPILLGGGVINFDVENIRKHYHLIVISMPHTPLIVQKEYLNNRYCYIPDSTQPYSFAHDYIEDDWLEIYRQRGMKVLEFLRKQSWVDKKKCIVAGHSQGSKVATKIAANNPAVSHLGLFAANPMGRIDQYIRQARLDAQLGKISWEEADKVIEEQFEFFQAAHHPDSLQTKPEYLAWASFSEMYLDDWLSLNIPIYMAYGTEDRTADLCDIVPLYFIQAGKENLSWKRYLGLEHNFFPLKEDGSTNYEDAKWPEVMSAFVEWTLSP
ncbi:MAG: hypothetical protein AAFY71_26140 [Bacteroidota bacterium]